MFSCGRTGFEQGPSCEQVDQNVVSIEDFEGGASGWSNNTTEQSESLFSEFLGPHAAARDVPVEVVSKRFTLSGNQSWLHMAFDLYQIDSWDGEAFVVFVDGQIYERRGFKGGQAVGPSSMTAFLGPFGSGPMPGKDYLLDGSHTRVTIEFDLYQIDSWDDEWFEVFLDERLAFRNRFVGGEPVTENQGVFDGGEYSVRTVQTGELAFGRNSSSWRDGIHHYAITMDTTDEFVRVAFRMVADEPAYNESFGIDNIQVVTDSGGVVSFEDFEDGPNTGWNTPIWHSNPNVSTLKAGALGFGAGSLFDDAIHSYEISIPSRSTEIRIGFGDALDEGSGNETFGIDNFMLTEACAP